MKKFKKFLVIELDEGSAIEHTTDVSNMMAIVSKRNGEERCLAIAGLANRNIEFITKEVEIED